MTVVLPSLRLRFVHLVAVWAYGVCQPVFSLLEGNPEFLAVRGFSRRDVFVFAVCVALVPPALAVVAEWLVGSLSPWLANVLHVLFLFLFLLPFTLQVTEWIDPSSPDTTALLVWGLAVAGAALYLISRAARLFLSFSLALPIIAILTFTLGVPVATDAASAGVQPRTRPPIVMVVLDEFPLTSLLTRSGELDATRFPGFARLAEQATWYRNATTVHDLTRFAVPAILTGMPSRQDQLPILRDHQQNLFTLLGSTYTLHVQEAATRLCPLRQCPSHGPLEDLTSTIGIAYLHRVLPRSVSASLPAIYRGYTPGAFERFLGEFQTSDAGPELFFTHLALPHAPWRFLPSGRQYGFDAWPEENRDGVWVDDPWVVTQSYQRHLLQVEYTDALIGRLVRVLRRSGIYDRALVIVVADHGASFQPGGSRRWVTRSNVADIARIPLFVKYPNQRLGRVDDRSARTIDLLPTIATVLGIDPQEQMEGRSLLAHPTRTRWTLVRSGRGNVRAAMSQLDRQTRVALAHKTALFGQGRSSLYRIGSNISLLGLRAPDVTGTATPRVSLSNAGRFTDVSPTFAADPAMVLGKVRVGKIPWGRELAIAVNGRVRALTRRFQTDKDQEFRALLPPSSLRPGYNRIDVFMVGGARSAQKLTWLGGSSDRDR